MRADAAAYRRDAAILAAILACLLAVTFAPFVFGDRSHMSSSRDVPSIYVTGAVAPGAAEPLPELRALDAGAPGWTTEPWLAVERQILRDRRVPWWDPFDGYGQPFAASMQPQPFYPPTTLLALHPSPRTYAIWILFRIFLAGWFAALFLRLFAGRGAAAVAGAATMFNGYFLLYYDMPHLSVEVELPMLLWATELVVRKPDSPARIAALATAAGLSYLGGMPESAMLVLTTSALYGIVRVLAFPDRIRSALGLIGAHAAGLATGAAMVVPFLGFVGLSFNTHEAAKNSGNVVGMAADGAWRFGLFTEFVPRAFGPLWGNILTNGVGHNGARGFFGCAAISLALVALIAALRRRGVATGPVLFFSATAAYFVLKRYGNPLVAWTGGLPVFRLIGFSKYGELVLGVSIAILAGFGISALVSRRAGVGTITAAFGITLLSLSSLTLAAVPYLPVSPLAHQFWVALAPALFCLLIAAGATLLIADGSARQGVRSFGVVLALVAVVGESYVGYLYPTIERGAPSVNANPYAGSPYLSFLDAHVVRDRERIMAMGGILFPNWSGAYGFADPRSLNALYPGDYIPFVDAFITTHPATFDDQFDRFVATRPISLRAPLVQRWLELSSIGWIVENSGESIVDTAPGGFIDPLWQEAQAEITAADLPAVHTTTVEIDGVAENALFEHPPHAIHYEASVPRDRPVVVADLAIDPPAYTGRTCGGPVTFTLEALDANGRVVGSTQSSLDAFDRTSDRHWRAVALDLSSQRGKAVSLHFSTASVVGCNAWALWGEPRFTTPNGRARIRSAHVHFAVAFSSPDAVIYRVPAALPRVSLFHRARSVQGVAGAEAALTSDAFNVHDEAVVDGSAPVLGSMATGDRVSVVASHSDEIVADVTTASTALLMQNDTWYPGWIARIDGAPAPLLRVDGIFRGVVVPGGHHLVEIAFDSPLNAIGVALSSAGLLAILALFGLGISRARRPAPVPQP